MALSDRVCVMNNARIEQIGSPADLYFSPRSVFVADFLGESNLIQATVREAAAGGVTLSGPAQMVVKSSPKEGLKVGQAVKFLVRPENMSIPARAEHENAVEATLRETLMIGQTTKLFAVLACGTEISCTQLTRDGLRYDLGQKIRISWSRGDTVVLAD